MRNLLLLLVLISWQSISYAQKLKPGNPPEKCASMVLLERHLSEDPEARKKYESRLALFNERVSQSSFQQKQLRNALANKSVPVVFHVVLTDQAQVTDAQLTQQMEVLIASFNGTQQDASSIPPYFAPLLGNTGITFCMAQRTPSGDPTTGIVRKVTTVPGFNYLSEDVKYSENGGDDSWDTKKYFNVWICLLTANTLGYATFPESGPEAEQGVVIDYRSLPGGTTTQYNQGKTLVHEAGHFFNLYHIWGDDGGQCTGSDFVDDTPNQGGSTAGCFTGIKTDNCTSQGDGIMYQNYMDYSFDNCLLLFTTGQANRMLTAADQYRTSLFESDACSTNVYNLDLSVTAITKPLNRECVATVTPAITIKNRGIQTVTSATIKLLVNGVVANQIQWTGSLATGQETSVSLASLQLSSGNSNLVALVNSPNGLSDNQSSNDSILKKVSYNIPITDLKEGFESTTFPPSSWDVVNFNQDAITWERSNIAAKTGNASLFINNFDNSRIGRKDDIRLPQFNIQNKDSAFFSFWVAAAAFSALTTANNNWDTLDVLISKDCGITYTSIYKKWGSTLVTNRSENTAFYVPASNEWRKDSIDLAPYINQGDFLLAFRNTTGFENNIYLDDIRLRTVVINPNLKKAGYLVTPNPASTYIEVQFFPNPTDLISIQVFNSFGQRVLLQNTGSSGLNYYRYDVTGWAKGMYYVQAQYANKVITKKLMKL